MRLRGVTGRDYSDVHRLYQEYDFSLDAKNLESSVVVENDNGRIIAVGSLVKLLEGSFLTDKSASKRDRIEALRLLIAQADKEVKVLGYESYYALCSNDSIFHILTKHFSFVRSLGTTILRWV